MNEKVVRFSKLSVAEFADKLLSRFARPVYLRLDHLLRHSSHHACLVTREAWTEYIIYALLTCRGS